MSGFLTKEQREELLFLHKMEDKRRYADRIKSVLLLDSGWSARKIAEILFLDEKSVRNYLKLYEEGGADRLCCDELKGSFCFLNLEQQKELKEHLEQVLYSTTAEIISYVLEKYDVEYSASGLTDLLHRMGFVYKKAKVVPGKADAQKQEEFLKKLEEIKALKRAKDKLYYVDGVHPQHNTVAGNGWILKGQEHQIKSNTGRQRINLNGALDADTHDVIIRDDVSINAQSTIELFKMLEAKNPTAKTIYAVLDNAKYYKNQLVQEYLKNSRVILIFLPPYAPNLNLIERLWKFFKKCVLANKYYQSFLEFKNSCLGFFQNENIKKHKDKLDSLLTDKFRIISAPT